MGHKKWEYKTGFIINHDINLNDELNKWGDRGWELVSLVANKFIDDSRRISNYDLVFKREKHEDNKDKSSSI